MDEARVVAHSVAHSEVDETLVEQRRVTPAASTKPLLPRSRHRSPGETARVLPYHSPACDHPFELYRGIEIRGGSPEPMRYWIEVRSGDDGHYASVLLPTEGAVAIPWERFYPTLGPKRVIPLTAIDALFVTVNTSSSRTGFSSELTIESLGFCR